MGALIGELPSGYKNFAEYDAALRKEMAEQRLGIHRTKLSLLGRDPWKPNDGVTYIDGRDNGTFTYALWTPRNPKADEKDLRGTLALRFSHSDYKRFQNDLSGLVVPQSPQVRVSIQDKDLGDGATLCGDNTLFRGVEKIERLPSKFGITFDYSGVKLDNGEVNLTVGEIRTSLTSRLRVVIARHNEEMRRDRYC